MQADFEYITSGDGFTSIMPNTPDAVATYNATFADGFCRLMPHELTAFKSQARKAGYTVRKAKPASMDDVLAELSAL